MSLRERYILDARLGMGGMAEVFRARRVGINDFARSVAIKRMLGGRASPTQLQEIFTTEARITSQLVHPNIVSVLDFDRDDDGRLCLVMELVDGCDLSRLQKTGLLPFEIVNYVIVEALKGLGHAHSFIRDGIKGIVHRDVSPHNLLLSWEGEVKVSDFGLAKARSGAEATATEGLKGKPAYMSPEQANSEPLDGRSDLFAIGTIMWELLVGRPLFGADDTRASLAAILFGTVPPPRQLRSEVPRDLERVALTLLERNRSARYRSAEHAIRALLACESSREASSAQLAKLLATRFGRPVAIAARSIGTAPATHRRATRARWPLGVAALAVLAGIIGLLGFTRSKQAVERTASEQPYVALVEKRPAPRQASPQFKYRLDAKELPPSCLLLLDWSARTAQRPDFLDEVHNQLVDELVAEHDELARDVTFGASIRKLDSDCRVATMATLTHPHAAPPEPFLAMMGPTYEEPVVYYLDILIERARARN